MFATPDGPARLWDFFAGRRQLAVYQLDNGPDHFCPGCTHFTNNVTDLDTLGAAGVSWITVSDMPLAQMDSYWASRGWTVVKGRQARSPAPSSARAWARSTEGVKPHAWARSVRIWPVQAGASSQLGSTPSAPVTVPT